MLDYAPKVGFGGLVVMLSLFKFNRVEISSMGADFTQWLLPSGTLLLGVFEAEDCKTTLEIFDGDSQFASDIPFKFMHQMVEMNLLMKKGWDELLENHGLEVVYHETDASSPPAGLGYDDESHYFVLARIPKAN